MKKGKIKNSKKKIVSAKHPIIQKKIDKALDLSIQDGKCYAGDVGFGLQFLSPFIIAAKATSAQIGVFSSMIYLIPSIFQIMTSKLIEKYSRKKLVLGFAFAKALVYLVLAAIALMFYFGLTFPVWITLLIASLVYIIVSPAASAWFSWMGSLVSAKERGKYFAKRNKISGSLTLVYMLIGSFMLDYFKKNNLAMLGFMILFILAALFRFAGLVFVAKQYEPRLKITRKDEYSFKAFLKDLRTTPFGRFVAYVSLFRVAWWIGAPFFAVYMLRDLGFSYVWYMAILISTMIFQLLFYPIAGKMSDKFGNARLMRFATLVISITPFLWLITPNKLFLIFVVQLTSGIGSASFLLASNNYLYDSLEQKKRSFGFSYFNLIGGMAIAVGSGIGSLLALTGVTLLGYNTLFIILVASIARIGFYLFSKGLLKEVRSVENFSYNWLFREIQVEGIRTQRQAMNNVRGTVEHVVRPKDLIKFGGDLGKKSLKTAKAVGEKSLKTGKKGLKVVVRLKDRK